MKPSPHNAADSAKGVLLALVCTVVTAGVPLGLALWVLTGAVGGFLSRSNGDDTASASSERTGERPGGNRTVDSPIPEEVAYGTEAPWQVKERQIALALATGRSEAFRFSEADLNEMIEAARRRGAFEGQAELRMRGKQLRADVRMPIRDIPSLEGFFLDARLRVELALENDRGRLYIREIVPRNGDWRSKALLRGLRDRDLGPLLEETPLVDTLRKQFRVIAIDRGELVVVTGGDDSASRDSPEE